MNSKQVKKKSVIINSMETSIEGSKEIENWDDLNIKTDLLRGIYAYGYEKPSEIQKKRFPILYPRRIQLRRHNLEWEKQGHFRLVF